ncbi:MAG: site-specific integrase [Armatimonadota bacterium]|nr:site-specific integrase [Armatimonadota bacterium]
MYRLLHRVFGFAVQLGQRLDNPLDRVPVPRYSPARRKPWSPEEASRFPGAARSHPLGPLFWLLATSGLRISEALALTWADVDLVRGTVTVRRTVHRVRGQWVYSPPKTRAGARTVSLPREVTEHLRRARLAAVQKALAGGVGFSDEKLVFSRDGTTPLHRRHVLRIMRSLCTRAGVPHVGLHSLRHLHASSLLACGVSLPEVSARLGHANTHVTAQVYAHVLSRDDRRLAELAAEALGLTRPL